MPPRVVRRHIEIRESLLIRRYLTDTHNVLDTKGRGGGLLACPNQTSMADERRGGSRGGSPGGDIVGAAFEGGEDASVDGWEDLLRNLSDVNVAPDFGGGGGNARFRVASDTKAEDSTNSLARTSRGLASELVLKSMTISS